jgi:lysyl-tRNA synthetase class 2
VRSIIEDKREIQARLAKLQEIRDSGLNPYPPRYHRTHTIQEAIALFLQKETDEIEVNLAGRLVAIRSMGKASFLDIRDGSGKIQVYLRSNLVGPEKYQMLRNLDLGDFIGVEGKLFRTRTGEVTVRATDFTILSKSLRPLPEKWHGLTDVEKRYRQRYLDLISNEEARRIFSLRSQIIAAMRQFLNGRGFLEVETPILHYVAGGAFARPFTTHHNALDQDFYLRIATELHLKRLIIGGFDKVYEIGRIFRNEGISTKHNPEFTTLESYEAYADYNDVMKMTEEMVADIAQNVLGTTTVSFGEVEIDFSPPWRRITLRDVLKERCGFDFADFPDAHSLAKKMQEMELDADEKIGWGKLLDKLFSVFVEPDLIQPTFVIDYPVEISPLAKRKPDDERLVERFEFFAGGMEIANAFTELNDPLEQRKRFEEQEELRALLSDEEIPRSDYDFLTALEYGMPPTGGLGVGVDRLVMLLTNQQSIREVILFPQMRMKE